jgi:hypothetical protein
MLHFSFPKLLNPFFPTRRLSRLLGSPCSVFTAESLGLFSPFPLVPSKSTYVDRITTLITFLHVNGAFRRSPCADCSLGLRTLPLDRPWKWKAC